MRQAIQRSVAPVDPDARKKVVAPGAGTAGEGSIGAAVGLARATDPPVRRRGTGSRPGANTVDVVGSLYAVTVGLRAPTARGTSGSGDLLTMPARVPDEPARPGVREWSVELERSLPAEGRIGGGLTDPPRQGRQVSAPYPGSAPGADRSPPVAGGYLIRCLNRGAWRPAVESHRAYQQALRRPTSWGCASQRSVRADGKANYPEESSCPSPRSESCRPHTEEDRMLVNTLCRYGGTTCETLLATRYAGKHRSGVYARLKRLIIAGWLEPLDGPSNLSRPRDVHALYVPTPLGYKKSGSNLGPLGLAEVPIRHTLAVAEIGLGFESAGRDYRVVTDREIRRSVRQRRGHGGGTPPADAAWILTGPGVLRGHPQGLRDPWTPSPSHRGPRHIAPTWWWSTPRATGTPSKWKLTPKSERELRAIVLALASSSRYATVSYYVSGQTTRTAVDRAVQAAAYALHAPNPNPCP